MSGNLIPRPFLALPAPGEFRPGPSPPLRIHGTDQLVARSLFDQAGFEPALHNQPSENALFLGQPRADTQNRARQKARELADSIFDRKTREQSYCLAVDESGAAAFACAPAGVFYAAVTLSGLFLDGAAPLGLYADRPALPCRAALIDVSRGRVPRLESLLPLVDFLARLKFNQLTFNIEDTFTTEELARAGARTGITPAMLRQISDHAALRHIELIPFQQSLGHLRGIVNLPAFADLAYDRELAWSVDPAKEESYQLIERLYRAQIEATGSRFFHAGCDEPFDMKKRYRADRFGGRPLPAVVRDHLIRLHGLLSDAGKTMMAWADEPVARPEILADLPRDLVLLHWMYGSGLMEGPDHYRPSIQTIARAGLPFYACTTTWSLMKIFPDLAATRQNHAAFISEAKAAGARGMMVTIWGDMGHMNLAGLELVPLALAARHGWEDSPDDDLALAATGAALAESVFSDRRHLIGKLAVSLDRVNRELKGPLGMGGVGFLLFFDEPLSTNFINATVADKGEAAARLREALAEARHLLAQMEEADLPFRELWLDHHLPALQIELLARKLELARFLEKSWPEPGGDQAAAVMHEAARRADDAAQLASGCLALLESRWLAGSAESDLEVNRKRYRRLIRAWRDRARRFDDLARAAQNGDRPPPLAVEIASPPGGYAFDVLAEMGLGGLL